MAFKIKNYQFMTKVNPSNKNETKLDILSWHILTSDTIFHCSQNTKIFQGLSYLVSFSFIANVSTNKNIQNQKLRSLQYLGYPEKILIVLS